MEKQKLTQKTWFTVLLLFIFFPLGLYLMWKNKKFSMVARIVISAIIAIEIIVFAGLGSESETEINNSTQMVSTDTEQETNDTDTSMETSEEQVAEVLEETSDIEETVDGESDTTEATETEDVVNVATTANNDTFEFENISYKIIEVDGGNMSGNRQANVAVDVGYGDRVYWGLTNEYGQLVYVIADEIILQDDSSEPVNSNGRYYSDEADVPGTEQSDLDKGHVIGDSLGGVSNAYNITPQNSTLNRYGDQAYMEKAIRDAGGCENFVATITYPDTTTQIPTHYHFEYTLNGNNIVDDFDNVNPDDVNSSTASTNNNDTTETDTNSTQNSSNSTDATASTPSTDSTVDEKSELAKIDTNGNGKVTIAEAEAAGYSMPIYSTDWLYKYMDDRDHDGMVGE